MYTVHFLEMFATVESNRSPLSPYGETEGSHWIAVELVLSRPWFFVSYESTHADSSADEDLLSVSQTVLVYGIGSVAQMIQSAESNESKKYTSVQICTPDHVNGTTGWMLETLDSVHTAHHPSYPTHTVDLFVTTEGKKYASCSLGISNDKLVSSEAWFKAPRK